MSTKFEVKFEEPKKPAPQSLTSPRESLDINQVKLRSQEKINRADEKRKSQIDSVVEKQKKHEEHAAAVRAKAAERKQDS